MEMEEADTRDDVIAARVPSPQVRVRHACKGSVVGGVRGALQHGDCPPVTRIVLQGGTCLHVTEGHRPATLSSSTGPIQACTDRGYGRRLVLKLPLHCPSPGKGP